MYPDLLLYLGTMFLILAPGIVACLGLSANGSLTDVVLFGRRLVLPEKGYHCKSCFHKYLASHLCIVDVITQLNLPRTSNASC